MAQIGTAGNQGPDIRSDCYTALEIKESGGIKIIINSKVDALYKESIQDLAQQILDYFGVEHASLEIIDRGALAFVLAARIEGAVRACQDVDKEYLLDLIPENQYQTEKDRTRRSRLYLPGNSPKLMLNAGIHQPDAVILDLEDSVAPDKKSEARLVVRNALRAVNYYGAERMVRINQLPLGLEDLEYIVPHHLNLVLLPKCESFDQVKAVDQKITQILADHNLNYPVYIMPIIESALGVVKAYEIASASERVAALAIGLEDYTADLGAPRTREGRESFFARNQLVNAARAAGVQAIDSVFSDVADMEALRQVVLESKSLGFDGMGCIHPRQIKVIHEVFAPTETEIIKAERIVLAFDAAAEKGLGVVSLGSKMIDPPVVKRAQKTIEQALQAGLIPENWKDQV
ncbi:MAG: citrate lyase ACP [Chloroflexi bacterium]|nr:citrate lyase ACP [Chloroflexota bacterium]